MVIFLRLRHRDAEITITHYLFQYCAKVMQTEFGEFRYLF